MGQYCVQSRTQMPFCNSLERDTHFERHGAEVGAIDAEDYERMADNFVLGPREADAMDCTRQDGDRVRFGFATHLFGVARTAPVPECIRTFYPVKSSRVNSRGGAAAYFRYECDRIAGVNL
jgi:hypothetical protein